MDWCGLKVSGGRITYVFVSRADTARTFGVLPDVVHMTPASPGQRELESIHRWWSWDFRSSLYLELKRMLRAPQVDDAGDWNAHQALTVAGVGLLSSIREEIGFSMDVISHIHEFSPDEVRLIVDSRKGLRYAEVLADLALCQRDTRFVVECQLRLGQFRVSLRLPSRVLGGSLRVASRLLGLRRSVGTRKQLGRVSGRGDLSSSAEALAFHSSGAGDWTTSISEELRRRSVSTAEAWTHSGIAHVEASGCVHVHRVRPLGFRELKTKALARAFETFVDVPGPLISTPAHLSAVSAVVSRRLKDYLPGMARAVALARTAHQLGAGVTLQENIITPAERAFLIESKRLGAHSLSTHHGLFNPDAPERDYMEPPSALLEWGRLGAELSRDFAPSLVVGNNRREEVIAEVVRVREQRPELTNVLIALGRPARIVDPVFFASTVRLIALASNEFDNLDFVVNLHPSDNGSLWNVVLEEMPQGHSLDLRRDRIYEAMANTTALITNHSTAGAEALVAGIPVICIESHEDPVTGEIRRTDFSPMYLNYGAAYGVSSLEELRTTLDEVVSTAPLDRLAVRRQSFGREFLATYDQGGSSVRATGDYIEALVTQRRRTA